ncbi:TonB-dependent receptor [Halorhodospira halochloris]|uniref:TonB-dependent receptor family protein n=1 Tax=Halorhodospira halochloris TaxID=1052 RepID=UPI001EE8014B|nr:TonB-dependent receptor [Halorhodospira halochloris]MCG5529307.1 TonB-dependent receptor [Halorhodospira halochloris]
MGWSCTATAVAQQEDREQQVELPPVTTTVARLSSDLEDYPAAGSTVGREAFATGRGLALDQGLDRVPGVHTQNRYNFAQDLRLSVRGFGARSPFGIRGIRVLVDGIPATATDGQSQLDAIDPVFVEQLEVLRGPSSALYGNASRGVFRFTTIEPPEEGQFVSGQVLLGSHRERAQRLWGGRVDGDWRSSVTASNVSLDGYREHAEATRQRLGIKVDRRLDNGAQLRLLGNIMDAPEARDPGGLRREQVHEDRQQAGDDATKYDTGEEIEQQSLALILSSQPSAGELWEGQAFLQRRDFYRRSPFKAVGQDDSVGGIITYERYFGGIGGRHVRQTKFAGRPLEISLGTEAEWQYDDRQRYKNEQGDRGDQTHDQLEQAQMVAGYAQAEWQPAERWRLVGGSRLDWLQMSIRDRTNGSGTDRERYTEPSYLLGASYALTEGHQLYTNASTAFETATLWEMWDQEEGGIDSDLSAQEARSYELGVRGSFGERLRYDLSLFQVTVENELVPQGESPETYENAGETRRRGIELGIEARPHERLEITSALAVGEFIFRDFEAPGIDWEDEDEDDLKKEQVSGNNIPGIPRAHGYLEVVWHGAHDWRYAANIRAADKIYADDRNTQSSSAHAEVGLHVSRLYVTDEYEAEPFVGINNLLDEEYNANVKINAASPSDGSLDDGAYYEPAPERTFYAGITVRGF